MQWNQFRDELGGGDGYGHDVGDGSVFDGYGEPGGCRIVGRDGGVGAFFAGCAVGDLNDGRNDVSLIALLNYLPRL